MRAAVMRRSRYSPARPPHARRSWSVCLHRVTPHVERTRRSTQFAIILTQPAETRQNAEVRTARRGCSPHSEPHGERPQSPRRRHHQCQCCEGSRRHSPLIWPRRKFSGVSWISLTTTLLTASMGPTVPRPISIARSQPIQTVPLRPAPPRTARSRPWTKPSLRSTASVPTGTTCHPLLATPRQSRCCICVAPGKRQTTTMRHSLPTHRICKSLLGASLVEMANYSETFAATDALVARQPTWQRDTEDPSLYARSEWLDATLLAGLIRYCGD
jgi:hypothetical protein